jgi:phosphoribosylanthranilate isomerase
MTEVKICGLMRPEDVEAARSADYLGFVVATGTRRSLQPSEAKCLISLTDRPTVVVTTSSEPAFINYLVSDLKPFAVQLNGPVDKVTIKEVRSKVPCEVWTAIHVGPGMPSVEFANLSHADRVVLDTASPQGGGSGLPHDHTISAALAHDLGARAILAGGLTPENVAAAIATVRPSMVDVSSGVETNGTKDQVKIQRFIKAVKRCR